MFLFKYYDVISINSPLKGRTLICILCIDLMDKLSLCEYCTGVVQWSLRLTPECSQLKKLWRCHRRTQLSHHSIVIVLSHCEKLNSFGPRVFDHKPLSSLTKGSCALLLTLLYFVCPHSQGGGEERREEGRVRRVWWWHGLRSIWLKLMFF